MKTPDRTNRRTPIIRPIAIALALALCGVAAAAPNPPRDTTISAESASQALDQTWSIASDASIEVHNVRGSVTVSAGVPGQAALSGTLGQGSKLVVEGGEQHLELRVESSSGSSWFGNQGPREDSDLDLKLPAGVSLELDLVSADGRVTGIDGKSLNVECVSGKVTIQTGSPRVDVECVSGDVTVRATREDADGHMHLQTVSGDIEADGVSGRVKLETVSGRVRANGKQVQEFEGGSVSGNIQLDAALAPHGRFKAETMSGDIRALLQADLSAHIEAETFSGDIRSDFGEVKRPEYGPGSSLDVRTGNGDSQVNADTFSGSIEIRKRQ